MVFDMFWGGAPLPDPTGKDDATTADANHDELGYHDNSYHDHPSTHKKKKHREPAKTTKLRVPGGLAPTSKRITADYDSDDARIIELKQQLYTDEYVANVLQQESRIRYQAKTVGSRWQRLRRILYDKEDERLDEELSDWHIEEDEPLSSIAVEVEKKYRGMRESLETKKWDQISHHLAEKLGRRKYTGKACRERFEALRDGTALMPIELDEDKERRRRIREGRVVKAKQARLNAENAAKEAEDAKKARQLAKKKEREDAERTRTVLLVKRQTDKAERERIKEERRVNKEQAAQRKIDTLKQMRIQRDWNFRKRRHENELCRKFTNEGLDGRAVRPGIRKDKDVYESEEADESGEEEMRWGGTDDNAEDESGNSQAEDVIAQTPRRRSTRKAAAMRKATVIKTTHTEITPSKDTLGSDYTVESTREETKAFVSVFNKAPITRDSLLNPRSVMSNDELDALLTHRNLTHRNNESHAEIVARLAASDNELKGTQLDALLANRLIKTKGKKADKIRRLQEADAAISEQGQMGISSTDLAFMQRYEGYSGQFASFVADAVRERAAESEAKKDSVMC